MNVFWWWLVFALGVACFGGGFCLVCWSVVNRRLAGILVGIVLMCVGFAAIGVASVHANDVCAGKEAHCT